MKLIVLACVLGVVTSQPYGAFNYLMKVGVPLAARTKAAEEATDFDGSRILGGSTAVLGQYPYMGGLVITLTTGFTAVCGSSLLTNTRLVTAAHCWYDGWNQARSFIVVLGSLTLFAGGIRITSTQVFPHPAWNPSTAINDIAIINVPTVLYNDVIQNIALPTGSLLTNTFVGTTVRTAGWGLQSDAGIIGPGQVLHHVSLQVVVTDLCRSVFGAVASDHTLCVSGAAGRSTCSGDSGGPLLLTSGGRDVLIGVGSFRHRDSCSLGYPTGFTKVSSYIHWINERLYS